MESEDRDRQNERTLVWLLSTTGVGLRVPEKFGRLGAAAPQATSIPRRSRVPTSNGRSPLTCLRCEIRTVRSAWASGRWRGLGWARLDWGSVPRPASLRRQWGGAAPHPETSRER
ncbi:uncharacterized protein LOC110291264 [Mus caroli]|uniref:Uncharacterized protein LOC110291264 n=1 Tax=Mus caroli TaxID=10089 RepID=A0A6P5PET6_MUSCR|nr:uncharacterized protein LOC110291264 [Mus caroli]